MSLVLAEFAFYQSLGPALAIGIALMLLAGLTLLPALLAIFGRAVFWPTGAAPRTHDRHGLWDRIGIFVTRRPGPDAPGRASSSSAVLALTLTHDRRGRVR